MKIAERQRSTGSHFYKYCSAEHLDRLENLLREHRVYLPTTNQLNDPREAKPRLTPLALHRFARFLQRSYLRRNPGLSLDAMATNLGLAYTGIAHWGVEEMRRHIAESLYESWEGMRILSMSKRWDSLPMWAKYADDHRGYCLEFANAGMFARLTFEVEYVDDIDLDVSDDTNRTAAFFFKKTRDWASEEEVRIVVPKGPLEPSGTLSFEPSVLARIILGKDATVKTCTEIAKWAAARVPALKVVQARYDSLDHQLRLVDYP